MKTFKDRMREHGATPMQLDSGTARIAEDVVAEMSSEELSELGTAYIGERIHKLELLIERAEDIKAVGDALCGEMKYRSEEARQVLTDMYDKIDTLKIEASEETKQATLLFANVLMQTKEAFGEKLSDEVMKSAIEAGSYGMWRSIMGEKFPKQRG